MKRSTFLVIAGVLGVVVLFFFMTTAKAREECHVCVEYRGRTNCATAVGETQEQAREAAQTTACGPVASGMDQTIACGNTPPARVQCRTR